MSLLAFHLDQRSSVPYYVQLIQQVKHALMFGVLKPGDRLPTVKEAVAQLAINPNTVLRAYRDLESETLVVSRPGLGTFVAQGVQSPVDSDSYWALRAALERVIAKGRADGLDDQTLSALFAHVLRAQAEEVA